MPLTVSCPQCQKQLQVPDHLLGQQVKCPVCGTILSTPAPAAPPTASPVAQGYAPQASPAPPRPHYRRADYEEAPGYEEEDDRPRRRQPVAPHRGGLILTLGILSLVLCGIFTGIPAWIMGNNDLAQMRAGLMDRSGEGTTQAGRICGMISVILTLVGIGCLGISLLVGLLTGR